MPSTIETTFARAVRLHQDGGVEEAEPLYRRVLARQPDHAGALKLLGVASGQRGRHEDAARLFERALRLTPDDPSLHYNLGNVRRELGALEEAVASFEAVLVDAPDNASASFNLGATLLDLERTDDALRAFRQTVAADPSHVRARRECARLLVAAGRLDEAVTQWAAAVAIEPGMVDDHLQLGIALHRTGRLAEAEASFRRVLELEPRHAGGWSNLGAALRTAGRSDEAADALERAIAIEPTLSAPYTNLALAHLDRGDASGALDACRRAIDVEPEDARAHRTLARVLVAAGEHEAAEEHLRLATRLTPASAAGLVELADVLTRLGRYDEADVAYGDALAQRPESVIARLGRVTLLGLRGHRDEALALAERTLQEFPEDVLAIFTAAARYVVHDRHPEAATLLERALDRPDLTPGTRRMLLFKLGDARDRLAEYDAAWAAYTEANRLKGARFDRDACAGRAQRIIATFDRNTVQRLPRGDTARPRPVFFAGMPRSGSTLIEQILACHPDVAAGGELCLLERTENRLPMLAGRTAPYPDGLDGLTGPDVQRLAAFGRETLAGVAAGRAVVTDKSLSNALYLGLIEALYPDARVIVCERDPIDTCLSCYFQDFVGALPHTYDLEDLAFAFAWHERLLAHWRDTLGLPVLTVRYEELVSDQERVSRDLVSFCGLDWDDRCLHFHDNDRVVHTSSAAQVRRPMYGTSAGRHRHYADHLEPLRRALASAAAIP